MKKLLIIISTIFISINCYSQFSKGYNKTLNRGGYYGTSQIMKENYDYDWKTYECVNPNEVDTVIMFDGEEYEMFVYPQGRSFDTKSYWNNEPLDLPKWVKTMIYYDLCNEKKYTEFLISPQFNKYYGEGTNISLYCLYNYRVVLKSKNHEYWYDIFGKGGCSKNIKLGEYHLNFNLSRTGFSVGRKVVFPCTLEEDANGIYELTEWGGSQEDYDLISSYLRDNQERIGIKVLLNGDAEGSIRNGVMIEYWLDEIWSDQAKQFYSLYNKQRRNSLN